MYITFVYSYYVCRAGTKELSLCHKLHLFKSLALLACPNCKKICDKETEYYISKF